MRVLGIKSGSSGRIPGVLLAELLNLFTPHLSFLNTFVTQNTASTHRTEWLWQQGYGRLAGPEAWDLCSLTTSFPSPAHSFLSSNYSMPYSDYTHAAPGSLHGTVKMRALVSAVAQAKPTCVKHSVHACGIRQGCVCDTEDALQEMQRAPEGEMRPRGSASSTLSLHPGLKGCPVLTSFWTWRGYGPSTQGTINFSINVLHVSP